ncbi:hypothetical protein VCEM1536_000234B, partial [Vibrio cholerae O1 str. EM-1536]
EGLDHE